MREFEGTKSEPPSAEKFPNEAQWWMICLVVASTGGAILYRWLRHDHLMHSSAMFLGVPAVLVFLLALTPKAKTLTVGILKGITLALLIVAPLLGEGYVCIMMASPLFYAVGLVIGVLVETMRKRRGVTLSCIAIVMLPMCLEGVAPQLTFDRTQTVEAHAKVDAPAGEVEAALAQSLRVDTRLPAFLGIGFPRPLWATGTGLAVGDLRTIHFSGAEGDPPGDLVMRVAERRPGYVRFERLGDASKLTQWVVWDSSEVEWTPLGAGRTAVTWRIHFERELDPAWYFGPWERAAVREAAQYLIAANATPAGDAR